jgi:hypothetical protein
MDTLRPPFDAGNTKENDVTMETERMVRAQRGWAVVYFHPVRVSVMGGSWVGSSGPGDGPGYFVFPVAGWLGGRPVISMQGQLVSWEPGNAVTTERGEVLKDGWLSPPTHPKAWK